MVVCPAGFFLFIFYYNTSQSGEMNVDESGLKSSNTGSTLTTRSTNPDDFNNPYNNLPKQKVNPWKTNGMG